MITQPGPEGKDTYAHAHNPTTNYGDSTDLDEGDIQNLHTLRLHARHPWGSRSTSWAEIDVNAHPTPEPATCLLLAAGLLGLARRRRRRA